MCLVAHLNRLFAHAIEKYFLLNSDRASTKEARAASKAVPRPSISLRGPRPLGAILQRAGSFRGFVRLQDFIEIPELIFPAAVKAIPYPWTDLPVVFEN